MNTFPQLNPNAIQKDLETAQERQSNGKRIKFFALKDGVAKYHLLAAWSGNTTGTNYYEVGIHFLTDPLGKSRVYTCPANTEGYCVLCENSYKLKNTNKKLANAIRRQRKFLYNVVSEKGELGVLTVPVTVQDLILHCISSDMVYGKNPVDPNDGLFLRFNRIPGETPLDTTYSVINDGPRCKVPQTILDQYETWPKLNEIYATYTNAELVQVLNGNFDPKDKTQNNGAVEPKEVSPQDAKSVLEILPGVKLGEPVPLGKPIDLSIIKPLSTPVPQPLTINEAISIVNKQ